MCLGHVVQTVQYILTQLLTVGGQIVGIGYFTGNSAAGYLVTGSSDKIEAIRDMLGSYGIIEMARTGIIALERGSTGLTI